MVILQVPQMHSPAAIGCLMAPKGTRHDNGGCVSPVSFPSSTSSGPLPYPFLARFPPSSSSVLAPFPPSVRSSTNDALAHKLQRPEQSITAHHHHNHLLPSVISA